MGKRSRFQAPRVLTDFVGVLRALREVQESLDSISQGRADLGMNLRSFNLTAGNFHRASAPAAGMQARLPKASGQNLGDAITLHLEGMLGQLDVFAAPGDTVNGLSLASFTEDGVVVLWSNGVNAWSSVAQLPTNSPASPSALTWANVLTVGNTSSGSDPTISATDTLQFAALSPGINAAGDLVATSAGDMHLHPAGGLHLGHTGDTNLVHIEADAEVDISAGVDILIQSATSTAIQAGTSLGISTGAVLRWTIESDGSWNIGGSNGAAGMYLRSFGSAAPPQWSIISVGEISGLAAVTGAVSHAASGGASTFSGIRDNGTLETARSFLNFVAGTNTTVALTQDVGNDEIEVAVSVTGITSSGAVTGAVGIAAGGGNSTFDGNRVNDTALANRSFMDFANGDSITVSADDAFAGAAGTTCRYTHSYTGTTAEIVNSTATSNLGTINIATLVCGGTYRVSSASSDYSIEGFTARSQGFWFTFISEDTGDSCTLFNEDATATATNRLALPGQRDVSAVQLRGIFIYNGSRWSFVSQNPSAIGTSTNYVEVSTAGTPVINLVTGSGDINASAGGEMLLSGDNCTLTSTASNGITTVTPGFLQLTENSASGATVIAGRGMFWVRNTTPSCPMFTDDTNIDSTPWGFPGAETAIAVGTTNNFALADDAQVARRGAGAGASVLTGMAGGRDGRMVLISNIDGTAADTVTLNNDDAGSTAANRFYCPNVANFVIRARGSVFVRYDAGVSRWMVIAP